jgi:hypothetical protein
LGRVGLCFSKALYYVMFEIEFTQCERCTFRGLHFFAITQKKYIKVDDKETFYNQHFVTKTNPNVPCSLDL